MVEHSQKATELYLQALEIHDAEMRGDIARVKAVEQVLTLTNAALKESTAAIRLMRELADGTSPPAVLHFPKNK